MARKPQTTHDDLATSEDRILSSSKETGEEGKPAPAKAERRPTMEELGSESFAKTIDTIKTTAGELKERMRDSVVGSMGRGLSKAGRFALDAVTHSGRFAFGVMTHPKEALSRTEERIVEGYNFAANTLERSRRSNEIRAWELQAQRNEQEIQALTDGLTTQEQSHLSQLAKLEADSKEFQGGLENEVKLARGNEEILQTTLTQQLDSIATAARENQERLTKIGNDIGVVQDPGSKEVLENFLLEVRLKQSYAINQMSNAGTRIRSALNATRQHIESIGRALDKQKTGLNQRKEALTATFELGQSQMKERIAGLTEENARTIPEAIKYLRAEIEHLKTGSVKELNIARGSADSPEDEAAP